MASPLSGHPVVFALTTGNRRAKEGHRQGAAWHAALEEPARPATCQTKMDDDDLELGGEDDSDDDKASFLAELKQLVEQAETLTAK